MIYKESEMIESITNKNIENFNKNGGVDMYVHKEDEKEDILKKMEEVDKKYELKEYVAPELQSLGLEEMIYEAPSEEDIEQKAKDSLQLYKDNELQKLDTTYSSRFNNLEENVLKALDSKTDSEDKTLSDYKKALDRSKNTNIKRGLSRSSILENAIKEIEGAKESKLSDIELEYEKKINKLENERSILEQQRDSALTSFDISYATKLQNQIASINSEIAKEQAAVLKHNQDIAKQEEAHIKEQEKAIEEDQKAIDKKNQEIQSLGQTQIEKIKAQEKYDILHSYLSNLSKANALSELEKESDTYKTALGSYYNLLYAQMLKRQE